METPLTPPAEKITGEVHRVRYENPDTGFAVLVMVDPDGKKFVACGVLAGNPPGKPASAVVATAVRAVAVAASVAVTVATVAAVSAVAVARSNGMPDQVRHDVLAKLSGCRNGGNRFFLSLWHIFPTL